MRKAQAILAQYNTRGLVSRLEAFPERIYQAKNRMNAARATMKDTEANRAAAEAELALSITAECDEKGKAKFPNAEARTNELTRRKVKDEAYREVALAAHKAESALNDAQAEVERLADDFKATRYVARIIVAELALLAEDDEPDGGDGSDKAGTDKDQHEPF